VWAMYGRPTYWGVHADVHKSYFQRLTFGGGEGLNP